MNVQTVNIVNRSSEHDINIFLNSPEDANVPDFSSSTLIKSNSELKSAYPNATANLFVWMNGEVVWKGVVPTKTQGGIEIFPEDKKVMFENIELPGDFQTVTSFSKKGDEKGRKWISYTMWIILIVIILFLFYYFVHKRKS